MPTCLDLETNQEIGWGGRIRTSAWRYQKPLPYHLATPQNLRKAAFSSSTADHQVPITIKKAEKSRSKARDNSPVTSSRAIENRRRNIATYRQSPPAMLQRERCFCCCSKWAPQRFDWSNCDNGPESFLREAHCAGLLPSHDAAAAPRTVIRSQHGRRRLLNSELPYRARSPTHQPKDEL